jgi:hypothetical protein
MRLVRKPKAVHGVAVAAAAGIVVTAVVAAADVSATSRI